MSRRDTPQPMKATDLQTPLVPAEVDLRDLDGFMLNVERLLASELWALTRTMPDAFRGAAALWSRSWKQVPAASLPNDENVLAAFAEMPLARFRRQRELVMRGFVLCSDGRFYHHVLAADALKAWEHKKAYQTRRDADRKRLSEWREKRHPKRDLKRVSDTGDETQHETRFERSSTGTGTSTSAPSDDKSSSGASAAPHGAQEGAPVPENPQPITDLGEIPLFLVRAPDGDWSIPLFRQGLAWLARTVGEPPNKLRSLIGRWLKLVGDDHKALYDLLAEAQRDNVADPRAWISARIGAPNGQSGRPPQRLTGTAAAIAGIAAASDGR